MLYVISVISTPSCTYIVHVQVNEWIYYILERLNHTTVDKTLAEGTKVSTSPGQYVLLKIDETICYGITDDNPITHEMRVR